MFLSKRFFPLFVTQFLGAFNDNLLKNAIVILITFKGATVWGLGPAQIVTLAGGIFIVPFFLFSATAGQLSDVHDKSVIARWVKISEILIMAIVGVGVAVMHFELLLFALFLMGVHSTFFGPMKYSILPQHLSEDELVAGNAYIEAATFLAILLGTLLGGLLIGIPGTGPTWVAGCLFFFAVMGYASSRFIPPAPALAPAPGAPAQKVDLNLFRATGTLIRYSRQTRSVWLSILGISWFWCIGACVLSLIPTLVRSILHGNEGVVTLFLTVFSVGIGAGSILCKLFSRNGIERGLVPLGAFGLSWGVLDVASTLASWQGTILTAADAATHPHGLRLLAGFLAIAISGGLYIVPLYALMQQESDPASRSQVIAGNNVINAVFMVIGALGLGALQGAQVPMGSLFAILGVLNLVVSLYIFFLIPEFFFRFLVWGASHTFYRLQIRGRENLPQTESAIVVANHVTFVDWMFVSSAIPRPLRFIVDANYVKGPVGWIMKRLGKVIPITTRKESAEGLQRAMDEVHKALAEGSWICIFPEGGLTWDGSLQLFRPGVTRIVGQTPIPVIPVGMTGLWGSWFSRFGGGAIKKLPRRFRAHIGIDIGKPVAPTEATPEELRQRVKALIEGAPQA